MAEGRTRMAAVESTMQGWRAIHPAATLDEIEAELDRQVASARAVLLTELVAETMTAVATQCPTCGHALVHRGQQTRQIYTDGGELIALTRQYASCPACGAGLFPPG